MLRIKEIIKERGLTIGDIAEKLGIARETATRQINGNPTIETLQKYAEALNVPIFELFEVPPVDRITCPHCGKHIHISK